LGASSNVIHQHRIVSDATNEINTIKPDELVFTKVLIIRGEMKAYENGQIIGSI